MELISMTDFVFKCRENKDLDNIRSFWACERYAKFLKQPLKLEMFVPCDEDGNVLEKPYDYKLFESAIIGGNESWNIECKNYQKAKEKVLFKNTFEHTDVYHINYLISNETIESGLELDGSIELTENAIKQIVS